MWLTYKMETMETGLIWPNEQEFSLTFWNISGVAGGRNTYEFHKASGSNMQHVEIGEVALIHNDGPRIHKNSQWLRNYLKGDHSAEAVAKSTGRLPNFIPWKWQMTPLPLYVTGFVRRGLPHTSNLPTLTINNFRLRVAIPLKFEQQWAPT